ncbi:hypothetical protein ACFFX0_00055 [Citricoccus parietis]|uniref:Uncharacterized protein n=1 Tax=Citricoccus parietis TaxID=592307 RepID=A0ABV5FSM8_9MICC
MTASMRRSICHCPSRAQATEKMAQNASPPSHWGESRKRKSSGHASVPDGRNRPAGRSRKTRIVRRSRTLICACACAGDAVVARLGHESFSRVSVPVGSRGSTSFSSPRDCR